MTLTRPAYHVQVRNVTRGWEYTTYEGAPPTPDAPVVLADDMTHEWGFTDGRVPGPFDPATGTFKLAAASVNELPTLVVGDTIIMRAIRLAPGDLWPPSRWGSYYQFGDLHRYPLTYFEIIGRLDSPTLTLDPNAQRPVIASATVTDYLADLNQRYAPLDKGAPAADYGFTGTVRVFSAAAQINWLMPEWWQIDPTPDWIHMDRLIMYSGRDAHEILNRIGATYPHEFDAGHPVVAYPRSWMYEHPPNWTGWRQLWNGPPREPGKYAATPGYWAVPIRRMLPPGVVLLRLVWPDYPAGFATVEVAPSGDLSGVAFLDACHVRTPVAASKSREQAINEIIVEGTAIAEGATTPDDRNEATRSRSRAADTEFGTVTRTIPTLAQLTYSNVIPTVTPIENTEGVDHVAEAFAPDGTADDQPWGFDAIEVCTWLMDDAELDQSAPLWWPTWPTGPAADYRCLTQVYLHDVDPDVNTVPADRFLTGIVTGATHSIVGGRLTIAARLIGGTLPPDPDGTGAVTYAELTAEGTPWSDDFTAQTVDPSLTFEHFRVIGAPQ